MNRKYYRIEVRDHDMNLLFVGEYPVKTNTARARRSMLNRLVRKANEDWADRAYQVDANVVED